MPAWAFAGKGRRPAQAKRPIQQWKDVVRSALPGGRTTATAGISDFRRMRATEQEPEGFQPSLVMPQQNPQLRQLYEEEASATPITPPTGREWAYEEEAAPEEELEVAREALGYGKKERPWWQRAKESITSWWRDYLASGWMFPEE